MAAAFVQSLGWTANSTASQTSTVLSISKTVTAGYTIVVGWGSTLGGGATGVTDNLGNTYAKVEATTRSLANADLWSAPVTTGGSITTITVAHPSSQYVRLWAAEVSGVVASPAVGGGTTDASAGPVIWMSSGTIPANGLAIGFETHGDSRDPSAGAASGSPSTTIYLSDTGNDHSSMAYAVAGGSPVTSFVGTTGIEATATNWAGAGAIFSPSGAGSASPAGATATATGTAREAQVGTGGGGSGTLAERIAAATAGSTLNLSGLTFNESRVNIGKALTIVGGTLLYTSGYGIRITSSSVTLDGMAISGPGDYPAMGGEYGIHVLGTHSARLSGINIRNCSVYNNRYSGIWVVSTSGLTIHHNTVGDCQLSGITILDTVGGTVDWNRVSRISMNPDPALGHNSYGITLDTAGAGTESYDVTVSDNVVEDVPWWHGLDTHSGQRISFLRNIVRNCSRGMFITQSTIAPLDIVVRDNWLFQGTATYDLVPVTLYGANGITFTNNRYIGWGGQGPSEATPWYDYAGASTRLVNGGGNRVIFDGGAAAAVSSYSVGGVLTGPVYATATAKNATISTGNPANPAAVRAIATGTAYNAAPTAAGNAQAVTATATATANSATGRRSGYGNAVAATATVSARDAVVTTPASTSDALAVAATATGTANNATALVGGAIVVFPVVETSSQGGSPTPTDNHAIAIPTGVVAGNLIVICCSFGQAPPQPTAPPGFSPLGSGGWLGYGGHFSPIAGYYKIADGSEGSATYVTTASACAFVYAAYRISGFNTATPGTYGAGVVECSLVNYGTSAYPEPPNLAPSWGAAATLWIAVEAGLVYATLTVAPADYTNQKFVRVTTPVSLSMASRALYTANEEPTGFTVAPIGGWDAYMLAVRPAAQPTGAGMGAATGTANNATTTCSSRGAATGTATGTARNAGVTASTPSSVAASAVAPAATAAAQGALARVAVAAERAVAVVTARLPGVPPASAPSRWAAAYEYVIELFDSSTTFGPNVKLAEFWDVRNLGWSRYDRLPGRGFFTLYQTSPHLASIIPIITHVRITRVSSAGDVEVFNGIVSDYNSTGDDVLYDIYDYGSLLSLSRSGYRTMYPTKLIGSEIVSPEWLLAKNATNSALGFVATGTIEDPLGDDDLTAMKTNAEFGLMDQMRLALFYDLSEMGRANTIHHVTYEISRVAPFEFHFWKNKGSLVDVPLVLNGTVSEYQYAPNWAGLRNDLATLGTSVGGGAAEVVKTDPASALVFGLRQDVFSIKTLSGVAGTVETDQQQAVAARALKTATQGTPALWLTLVPGTIEPFAGWDICDRMPVEISNGTDLVTGNWRVLGARAIIDEPGERLQLLVGKVLT